jgi:hypothetical protein
MPKIENLSETTNDMVNPSDVSLTITDNVKSPLTDLFGGSLT